MSSFRGQRNVPLEVRFWSKVEGGDFAQCWLWTACIDECGYGRLVIDKRTRYAHRVSYELMVGAIPAGLELDHLCRIRHCVNPWHLDPVTGRVNVRRGISSGAQALRRTRCDQGHAFSEWGFLTTGRRRVCRLCRAAYLKQYRVARRAGLLWDGVEMTAALADYSQDERAALRNAPLDDSPRRAALIRHHGVATMAVPA